MNFLLFFIVVSTVSCLTAMNTQEITRHDLSTMSEEIQPFFSDDDSFSSVTYEPLKEFHHNVSTDVPPQAETNPCGVTKQARGKAQYVLGSAMLVGGIIGEIVTVRSLALNQGDRSALAMAFLGNLILCIGGSTLSATAFFEDKAIFQNISKRMRDRSHVVEV